MPTSEVVPLSKKSNINNWLFPIEPHHKGSENKITEGVSAQRFNTIFRRIVLCLRIIGIPLDPAGIRKESRLLQCWSIGLGCFSLFSSISLNIYALSLREKPMTTTQLSSFLDDINLAFALIMVPAGLLLKTSSRWGTLFSILNGIETVGFFRTKDFEKLNKICVYGGTAMLSLTILTCTGGLLLVVFPCDYNVPIRVLLFTPHLSIGCLLCHIVSFSVVNMLRILAQRISEIDKARDGRGSLSLVLQWQRCYYLINGLVNEINRSFGIILLVMVVFEFIWMVNAFFMTALEFKNMGNVQLVTIVTDLTLITTACSFTFLISVLNDIKQEALNFAYQLRLVNVEDPIAHQKIHELMLEILVRPPEITMMGLADVDLRLVPTLIGTTLTYIIILIQFQHGEGYSAAAV